MKYLSLMDPLETVNYKKDTSFVLMKAAKRKGFLTYYLPKNGLHLSSDGVYFDVQEVTPTDEPSEPFIYGDWVRLTENDVDVVFIRTDPPFDTTYLMHTWILDRLPKHVKVMNNPTGIRTVNEKVWALQFKQLIPPTLVTAKYADIYSFLDKHQKIVVKPTDGFGGQSIHILEQKSDDSDTILKQMTNDETNMIIVQRYVPESEIGDKRILLLNGEPLGAILRVHSETDFRNNFMAGGHAEPTEITERDLKIITELKPHLKSLGLFFVGIDIMGDYLIEVNVTSPTCLQEMNAFYGKCLEDDVISALL